MDSHRQLASLIELAESLGIAVRRAPSGADSAEHPGGALVRLKGREILFLDPASSPADQSAVAAGALRGRKELQERFLTPEIRQLIDRDGAEPL